ncbi:MAG: peptidylprolyl isomerase [Oscillospiraceae bacterium]|jgi:peptidyl-prolyl cis-trans isomerase B (cyclophilin B)|nr:peptidylprolyl isomerase [Oscillospiraceae bacterium]
MKRQTRVTLGVTAILLAALSALTLISACAKADGDAPVVDIVFRDFGTVTVTLDRAAAPITVENFLKLVGEGFYDGLTIHRVAQGFVIQGGDPSGDGTGGSEENIIGEFSSNGWQNNTISHKRGAISMARSNDMDSASSQFFIVLEDATSLDGEYAAFGTVTEGMDVVDAIGGVEVYFGTETPVETIVIESARVK